MAGSVAAHVAAAAGACACLVASLLIAPPASAIPSPEPRASARAETPTVITGALEAPPELSVAAQGVSPGRPGGQGAFDVVFASTGRGGQVVRDLQVRVAAPQGTSLDKISGERWRCDIEEGRLSAICDLRGAVGRDEDPPKLSATLDIEPSFAADVARIRAWARWAGEAPEFGAWVVGDQGSVTVYPSATLRLDTPSEAVTAFRNGPEQSRQMLIGVLDGQPGPARDIVLLNAGATLYAANVEPTLASGIERARAALDSGAARAKLDAFVKTTQGLGAS